MQRLCNLSPINRDLHDDDADDAADDLFVGI